MSEEPPSGRMPVSRRRILQAFGGGAGIAAVTSGLDTDGDDGNLYGGTMALSQAYNVAGNLWVGPDSAKSNVDAESGRIYLASDTDVEYYGDGGNWNLRDVGSSSQPVPAVHTDEANNADFVYAGDGPSAVQTVLDNTDKDLVYVHYDQGGTVTWDGSVSVPSGVKLRAWGEWTLKAGAEANLDTVDLHAATYRTLIYNENAATTDPRDSGIEITDFTIDYDESTKNTNSNHAPILLSEADGSYARDCTIDDAVPSVDTANGWRAFPILIIDCIFTHAEHCNANDGGYENVAIRGACVGCTAWRCETTNGQTHGIQIATFDDGNGQQGYPIACKIVECKAENDIMIHGPVARAWGCSIIESTSETDAIREIGNHWGTTLERNYDCSIKMYPEAEKQLDHITIDGQQLYDDSDTEVHVIDIDNRNGGVKVRDLTIRDVDARAAKGLVIDDSSAGDGTYDNIRLEGWGFSQNSDASWQTAVIETDNNPDIGRLYVDDVDADAQRLMQYDAAITRCWIKNTDLGAPSTAIQQLAGGSLAHLAIDDCINADESALKQHASTVRIANQYNVALGGSTPDATNYERGSHVHDTDNAGTIYFIYDPSTSSGFQALADTTA